METLRIATGEDAAAIRAMDRKALAIVDADGCIVHWSIGCEALYRVAADQALGHIKYRLLASRIDGGDTACWPVAANDRIRRLIDMRGDGSPVEVLEVVEPIDPVDGHERFALWMTDVGSGGASDARLRDDAIRFSLVTEMNVIAAFDVNVRQRTVSWQRGAWLSAQAQSGSLSIDAFSLMIGAEQAARLSSEVTRAVAARRETMSLRWSIGIRQSGHRQIEAAVRLVRGIDGRLARLVGVARDVTEWHVREKALLAGRAELRSILDAVPDAMIIADGAGRIHSFSRTAENLFGYSNAEAIGLPMTTLLSDHWVDYVAQARVNGAHVLTTLRADGSKITAELRVGEACYVGGNTLVLFIRDISDQVSADERLESLRVAFARLSRASMIGEFAAHLTHEINQPLTAIVNFVAAAKHMVNAGAATHRIGEMLEMASDQTIRAAEIVRRLFDFTMRHETELRPVPVQATLQDGGTLAMITPDRYGITVLYDIDSAAPTMFVDRVQIQQVIANLLRNSVQALREIEIVAPAITIRSRAVAGSMIEIAVSDNGPGIDEPTFSRLFQPFVTTKGEDGMGLGLSICRNIVEAHGGSIVATNLAGGGACFSFTVQKADADMGAA